MDIPKTWRDRFNRKTHFVGIVIDGDVEIVISKKWSGLNNSWIYDATTRPNVEWWIENYPKKTR